MTGLTVQAAVRVTVQVLLWIVFMGVLLFVPAWTLSWTEGWLYLAELFVVSMAVTLWLAGYNPDLLRERSRLPIQREQKRWDKIFMSIMLVLFVVWFALAGYDGGRLQVAPMPLVLRTLGAVLVALCFVFTWLTFRENAFAVPVVKIQSDRGQKVISTGPYAIVRHPMYAGAALFMIGTPLFLGSWLALAVSPLLIVLFGVRAVKEEETLAAELDGYDAYRQRVRWRLIPHVW